MARRSNTPDDRVAMSLAEIGSRRSGLGEEVSRVDSECPGDRRRSDDTDVPLAALDVADRNAIHPGSLSQVGLRKSGLLPQLSHPGAKVRELLLARRRGRRSKVVGQCHHTPADGPGCD
jgi:hypothetical protein